jgi:hypothetical protein
MFFKSVDKKFEEIRFYKVKEDKYGAVYSRKDPEYGFIQVLSILHKASGNHIIQSYDKDLFDSKGIGNTCVGLTYYEMKLALKKMKQLGYHKK